MVWKRVSKMKGLEEGEREGAGGRMGLNGEGKGGGKGDQNLEILGSRHGGDGTRPGTDVEDLWVLDPWDLHGREIGEWEEDTEGRA